MLHLRDLECTKIVQIVPWGRWEEAGRELATIVPRSYCTSEIGARQEELRRDGRSSRISVSEKQGDGKFVGEQVITRSL